MPAKYCDNHSVGVIITDHDARLLLITRATPPFGRAPVAGHQDQHGSADAAACAEVREEAGLTVTRLALAIPAHWRDNVCRRQPGPRGVGHTWTIFNAEVTGTVNVDPAAAHDAAWYTRTQLQHLTDRTVHHAFGLITADEFTTNPGLQPIWITFLTTLGLVTVDDEATVAVTALANGVPPSLRLAASTGRGPLDADQRTHLQEDQQ
jgi:8-oxo-dGTP pyrophosphatase MutT (NUDIX family)